ncbi:MAG: hypothetical protein KAT04_06545 [Methylococcales bacterium]|nr:hypothetical protein [Methylococcales bacterium]
MKDKESHSIRNGIIATVVGGILLSFWKPFKDIIVSVFSWSWGVIESIWLWLSSSHEIYGWLLLVLALMSIATCVQLLSLMFKKDQEGHLTLYKSDNLFGAKWHWQYNAGDISNLWCLCPSCNGELVYSDFIPNRYDYTHDNLEAKTDFICENCGATKCTLKGDKDYALSSVKREIRRKIRNNEWSNTQNN